VKHLFENWRQFRNERKHVKPMFQKAKIVPYIDLGLFAEGGNVFAGKTASIPREFIAPTLERYYEELERLFPEKGDVFRSFRALGSVGKKEMSGDIDLAGDAGAFFPDGEVTPEDLVAWNVDPESWESTFDRFKMRARTRSDAELGWRAFLFELATYMNENSQLIVADTKKVGPGIMFSLFPQFDAEGKAQDTSVQVDWMIGNIEWLEFAYYSDPPSADEEFLKGLHRTQLMLAMFLAKGISYHHSSGLKDRQTRKFLTDDPAEVVTMLGRIYGGQLERAETNNFPSLYTWLKENASDDEFREAIGEYLKILDKTKSMNLEDEATGEMRACGYIPRVLEDFWILHHEELGLKGKYICRDMNEKIWKYINRR
jgi:hypothetical protein